MGISFYLPIYNVLLYPVVHNELDNNGYITPTSKNSHSTWMSSTCSTKKMYVPTGLNSNNEMQEVVEALLKHFDLTGVETEDYGSPDTTEARSSAG